MAAKIDVVIVVGGIAVLVVVQKRKRTYEPCKRSIVPQWESLVTEQ